MRVNSCDELLGVVLYIYTVRIQINSCVVPFTYESTAGGTVMKECRRVLINIHKSFDSFFSFLKVSNTVSSFLYFYSLQSFSNGRHNIHEQYHQVFNSVVQHFLVQPLNV